MSARAHGISVRRLLGQLRGPPKKGFTVYFAPFFFFLNHQLTVFAERGLLVCHFVPYLSCKMALIRLKVRLVLTFNLIRIGTELWISVASQSLNLFIFVCNGESQAHLLFPHQASGVSVPNVDDPEAFPALA